MMTKLNKKNIIIFSISLVIVFMMEYEYTHSKQQILPSRAVLSIDKNIFDMFTKQYDSTKDTNHYWGIARATKLVVFHKDKSTTQDLNVSKKEGKNILCINSSCYRLIGIHYASNVPYATLYNKEQKKKLKDYAKKDTLEDNISIESISSNSVVFSNKDKTKSWLFKLFDVNRTKYKPKDTNETDT